MIYLDNASSSYQKPTCVKRTIKKVIKYYTANPGRSGHNQSLKSSNLLLDARIKVAQHFGLTDPSNAIFTSSCTESLNLALQGTVQPNGHIIATIYEHNSVLRTLQYLKEKYHISYTLVAPNSNGQITVDNIKSHLKPNTYLVVTNHTSNVTGHTQNIHKIGNFCHQHNLIFLVDCAQSGGHERINMEKDHINMLAVAGHKGFYSIQCGVLLINNCQVLPLKFGGTGTNSESLIQPLDYPEGLESGTSSLVNIASLASGITYVEKHWKHIQTKIEKLTSYLLQQLRTLHNCKIYSTNTKSGVVSFLLEHASSTDISTYLNQYGICVRSGLHCAPMIHQHLSTTQSGLVRISLSHFNQKKEINKLIRLLKNYKN